jgi:hypothetical protein
MTERPPLPLKAGLRKGDFSKAVVPVELAFHRYGFAKL